MYHEAFKLLKGRKLIKIFLLLLLFLISFFVRFFPVNLGSHYWDEAVYLQHAEIFSGQRSMEKFNEFDIRPPLLPLMISLSYIVSHSIISAHFVVSILSALGIIVIFFLAKEIFDEETAVFSSLLYALIPLNITLSHDILVDSFLPTFWAASALFVIKSAKTGERLHKVLAGIFIGFSILTKFTSLLLVFLPLFVFFFSKEKRERTERKFFTYFISSIKEMTLIVCSAILVVLPYLVWVAILFGNPLYTFINAFLVVNLDIPTSFTILYTQFNKIFPVLFLFGLFLFILNAVLERKIDRFVASIGLFSLIFFVTIHFVTHKEIRFLLPIIPFLTIISVNGFIRGIVGRSKKATKLIFLIFFLIIVLGIISTNPKLKLLTNGNFFINPTSTAYNAALWLQKNTLPDTIIYTNTQYPVLAYYSNRTIIVLPFWRSFQNNITEVMNRKGYYTLFSETARSREPTIDFVKSDKRFTLINKFGNGRDEVFIYEYNPI
ncbi:MAG: hypothetical protein DRP03_02250 [Candidatus Aenigmatarchaeota archaeon]|nr:MAG: hypothetical protein DRP03_02250 [Candidatus Aenigmarchaeota archaeon]